VTPDDRERWNEVVLTAALVAASFLAGYLSWLVTRHEPAGAVTTVTAILGAFASRRFGGRVLPRAGWLIFTSVAVTLTYLGFEALGWTHPDRLGSR
jgi:ABC-type uncharacterized transport system permease subunit